MPAARLAIADAIAGVNRYPDDRSTALDRRPRRATTASTPSQILIGAGSVNLCRLAFAATVDPGDEVVFAWPSFEMYPILAQQIGADAVRVPLLDQRHDLDAMADAVTDRTRLVFVCNPNNPTGTAVDRAASTRFLDRVPSDCLVVLDEAYREFVTAPDVPDGLDVLARPRERRGAAHVLEGVRARRAARRLRDRRIPDVIARAAEGRAAVPRQRARAGCRAARRSARTTRCAQRVDGVIAERVRLLAAMQELSLPVVPSEANFLWLDVPEQAAALGEFSERAAWCCGSSPASACASPSARRRERPRDLGARSGDRRRWCVASTASPARTR